MPITSIITDYNPSTATPRMAPYPQIVSAKSTSGLSHTIDECSSRWGAATATPFTIVDPRPLTNLPHFDYRCLRHGVRGAAMGWLFPAGDHVIKHAIKDPSGATGSSSHSFTVAANTRTQKYISPSGSDSNSGDSVGAAWRTWDKVIATLSSTTQYNFERGGTYAATSGATWNSKVNVYMTAYGSGALPIIALTSGSNTGSFINADTSNENLVIENLKFTTNRPAYDQVGHGQWVFFVHRNSSGGIALIGCEWDNTWDKIYQGGVTGDRGIGALIINCNPGPTYSQTYLPCSNYYVQGGCSSNASYNEVIWRSVGGVEDCTVFCCDFDETNSGFTIPNSKEALRLQGARFTTVYRCRLVQGPLNIAFQDWESLSVRIDENYLDSGTPGDAIALNKGCSHTTICNNVIRASADSRKVIGMRESSPVSPDGYDYVNIENNLMLYDHIAGSNGRYIMDLRGGTSDITNLRVRGNIFAIKTGQTATQIYYFNGPQAANWLECKDNAFCTFGTAGTLVFRINSVTYTFAGMQALGFVTNIEQESILAGDFTLLGDYRITPGTHVFCATAVASRQEFDYQGNRRGATAYKGHSDIADTTKPTITITVGNDGRTLIPIVATEVNNEPLYPATVVDLASSVLPTLVINVNAAPVAVTWGAVTNLGFSGTTDSVTILDTDTVTADATGTNLGDNATPRNTVITAGITVDNQSAQTGGADTTAPTISNVAVINITETTATITYNTDEAATRQVNSGLDTNYGTDTPASVAGQTLMTSHSVQLTGLTASTLYHYRVRSKDAANNEAVGTDGTFTTADVTPAIIRGNTPTASLYTANVRWKTDKSATSVLEWGVNNNYGQAKTNTALETDHVLAATGLEPDMTYHYRIKSVTSTGIVTVGKFLLGDGTLFTDDLSRLAIQPMPYFPALDSRYWAGVGTPDTIDETITRASADQYFNNGYEYIVLDMEYTDGGWYFNDAWSAPTLPVVDASIAAAQQIIAWIRDQQPTLKIGFYGWFGGGFLQNLQGNVNFSPSHVDFDADYLLGLAADLDFICPSFYRESGGYTAANWESANRRRMSICRQYFGVPAYPFISHRVAGSAGNALIGTTDFQDQYNILKTCADGAVWFTGLDTTVAASAYIDIVQALNVTADLEDFTFSTEATPDYSNVIAIR